MSFFLDFLSVNCGTMVALVGLFWAVGAFWWMNWRKGKIITSVPRTYAALSQGRDGLLLVRLPLIFYNTGAATIIIQNLQLVLEQNGGRSAILYFNQTVSKLDARQESDWAKQFPVDGTDRPESLLE